MAMSPLQGGQESTLQQDAQSKKPKLTYQKTNGRKKSKYCRMATYKGKMAKSLHIGKEFYQLKPNKQNEKSNGKSSVSLHARQSTQN